MPRTNKSYKPEFKIRVIEDMRKNQLGYNETAIKYDLHLTVNGYQYPNGKLIAKWERKYLEKGKDSFFIETRGRGRIGKGPKPKLDKKVEEDLIAENQRLRMENEFLKKLKALVIEREQKEKEIARVVYELRDTYKLKDLLAYAGIPATTYYYYVNYHNKDKDRKIKALIQSIYDEHKGRYGYRRVLLVLRNDYHYVINHKKVQKLMRELGLKGKIRKSKYRSYKGTVGKICPNYLNRDFNTTKANQKWVTDVSEFKLGEDKLYLSPILDLHGGYIVSYDLSTSPNLYQTRRMLDKAFKTLDKDEHPILHSDQGWQYQHKKIQDMIKNKGMIQSMSRKGNCLDNSVMENFFGRMKVEMFYGETFKDLDDLKNEIHMYMAYYNQKRIKSNLKGLTPLQYRNQSLHLNI